MCKVMEDMRNASLQEGIQIGRQEGLQEGRQKGRQEGLQEGRQEGLQEGKRETAKLWDSTKEAVRHHCTEAVPRPLMALHRLTAF